LGLDGDVANSFFKFDCETSRPEHCLSLRCQKFELSDRSSPRLVRRNAGCAVSPLGRPAIFIKRLRGENTTRLSGVMLLAERFVCRG
jgi:hypothetical protein